MDDDVDGAANLKVKSETEGVVKSLPMCFLSNYTSIFVPNDVAESIQSY